MYPHHLDLDFLFPHLVIKHRYTRICTRYHPRDQTERAAGRLIRAIFYRSQGARLQSCFGRIWQEITRSFWEGRGCRANENAVWCIIHHWVHYGGENESLMQPRCADRTAECRNRPSGEIVQYMRPVRLMACIGPYRKRFTTFAESSYTAFYSPTSKRTISLPRFHPSCRHLAVEYGYESPPSF
ncbi:hypothetical protein BS17DRAFT_382425 [Gyrodon lividus]|nr:hypothetical protein BS17DRAFT_382425 [Gyrodon lividus]